MSHLLLLNHQLVAVSATAGSLMLRAAVNPALPLQQETPLDRIVNGVLGLVILIFVALCLLGFVLVLASLLPNLSVRSKAALQQSPWRAFFIGFANYLFLGGISLLLMGTEIPPLGVIGLVIAVFLIAVTAVGLTGLIMLIGERLKALSGREISPLMQVVWGAVALELGLLLPFAGWFLLAPIVLVESFGTAVLAWRNRKQKENWE